MLLKQSVNKPKRHPRRHGAWASAFCSVTQGLASSTNYDQEVCQPRETSHNNCKLQILKNRFGSSAAPSLQLISAYIALALLELWL